MVVGEQGDDGAAHRDRRQVLLLGVRAGVAQVGTGQHGVADGVIDHATTLVHAVVELGQVIQPVGVRVQHQLRVHEAEAVNRGLHLGPRQSGTRGTVGGVAGVGLTADLPVVHGGVGEVARTEDTADHLRDVEAGGLGDASLVVAVVDTDEQPSVHDRLKDLHDTLDLLLRGDLLVDTRAGAGPGGHLELVAHAENVPVVLDSTLEILADLLLVAGRRAKVPVSSGHDTNPTFLVEFEPLVHEARTSIGHDYLLSI